MARVKNTTRHQKHKKIKKAAKGFKFSASRRVKTAKEAILHAGHYAYVGRKLRKRDMRKLWITRINAAARQHDMSYSTLMSGLKKANIELDRKMLAEIAATDPDSFEAIIKTVKK